MSPKWKKAALNVDIGGQRVGLFDVHIRRHVDSPQLGYRHPHQGMLDVPADQVSRVMDEKRRLWTTVGFASHSDVAYLSWCIVTNSAKVRELLGRRFPFLVVDELQDTGWFLGEILISLLSATGRAVLVGDGDQAIYSFGGASPEHLDKFLELPGATQMPLKASRRCPRRVCDTASHLSWSGSPIRPFPREHEGESLVLTFEKESDLPSACSLVEDRFGRAPIVLVRANRTLNKLLGRVPTPPKFSSRPLQHLWTACWNFRQGNMKMALGAAHAAVSQGLFGVEAPPGNEIEKLGLQRTWRDLVVSTLLAASQIETQQDALLWGLDAQALLKTRLAHVAQLLGIGISVRAPASKIGGIDVGFTTMGGTRMFPWRLDTVHGVKGETHDVVLFHVPKRKPCPSITWFSDAPEYAEERRIAFVAATRARLAFILHVHTDTYARLGKAAPGFISTFTRAD